MEGKSTTSIRTVNVYSTQFSQSGFSKQEQYGCYTYLFSCEEDIQDDD